MTSSEPAARAFPAAQDGEAPVLLSGHLHPAVLLLRLIDALRGSLFPLVLGLLVEPWLLILAGFLFLWQLGYALARYLSIQYTLTAEELVLREGILHRQERRIPIDRIQDLGFESSILRRVLGIAIVMVETASSKGAEAVLDSLGRGDAEHLRETLLAARAQRAATGHPGQGPGGAEPAPEPEWTVFEARAGDLLLRGLTDLRLSAVLVAGLAALELADRFGFAVRLRGIADTFFDWLRLLPALWVVALLVLLVGAVVIGAAAVAALGNVMVFHGFQLTLRGDTLLRRYGLLTRRQKTLPRQRIQRVTVEQNWLRRLLDVASVHADSAGSGRGAGEEAPGGFDVVVPMTDSERASALLPALLPRLGDRQFATRRASRRLMVRSLLRGALLASVVIVAGFRHAGFAILGALLLLPLSLLVGRLAWGNLAYGQDGNHLWLRFGVLGRYQAFVPVAKIQAAVLQSGPIQRWLGLADVTVFVAGGSPTRLRDLPLEDAAALQVQLATLAGRAAADSQRTNQRSRPSGPLPGVQP